MFYILINYWLPALIFATFFGSVALFLMRETPKQRILYFSIAFLFCFFGWVFIHEARTSEHHKEAKAAAWTERDAGVFKKPFR